MSNVTYHTRFRPRAHAQAAIDEVRRAANQTLHRLRYRPSTPRTPRIVACVPAHNEAATIKNTVRSLRSQSHRPDRIVVIADNCDDDTAKIAAGLGWDVTVIETNGNRHRKVGALLAAWREFAAHGFDYMLNVDADTVLERHALADLAAELEEDPSIAAVACRFTFDMHAVRGRVARALVRMQRVQFAQWTADDLYRDRNSDIIGGQASLFRVRALRQVIKDCRRLGPWDHNAETEDTELTLRLRQLGWKTKVSRTARAYAGPMYTLKSYVAQQKKWTSGNAMLLMRSGVRRVTWRLWAQQVGMGLDLLIRVLIVPTLVASLLIGDFRWLWIWAIPPALSILLNLKEVRRLPQRSSMDTLYAVTILPYELFLWVRLYVWGVCWAKVAIGLKHDGWQKQIEAEAAGR